MSVSSGMSTDSSDRAVAAHLRHLQLQGKAEATRYHRGHALRNLAKRLPVPLLEATPEMLYEWRSGLDHCAATIATTCSHVKMFYAWATGERLIAGDPASSLPVPSPARRLPRPIGEQDLADALGYASPRVRTMLILAGWCGMRAVEIAKLRAECVRIRDGMPRILIMRDATKGDHERVIPLPPFAIAELERAAGMPGPFRLHTTGLAFRKADGTPMPANLVCKLCNQALHQIGIPDTFHSLRHRYLTQVYEISHDIREVQELGGHAHIQTSAGYVKADASKFAATVNAIPAPEQEAS